MPLMNYTTTIDPEKTIGEIRASLRVHKVRAVVETYGESGEVESLTFTLVTPLGERSYSLPVNVDGMLAALRSEKRAGKLPSLPESRLNRAQAARVAWRVLKVWLEAQLTIVQAQVVTINQVMLPYEVTNSGQTVYEAYMDRQLKLASPAKA